MRYLRGVKTVALVLGSLVVVASAHADPAAAVKEVLDGRHDVLDVSATSPPYLQNVWVLGPDGTETTRVDDVLLTNGPPDPRTVEVITWKLGALTVGTDDARGVAWFQAPLAGELGLMMGMQCCESVPITLRASGVAVRDARDKPWHVAAIGLSRQLPDAQLWKGATDTLPVGDALTDDNELAKAAAGWFPATGDALLGKSAASGVTLVASGTAPNEYATGAAVKPLVAAWDKAGMRAKSVDAKLFAHDTIGIAAITVGIPYKKKAAPMVLVAVAIREGKAWKWVSLQWTTALAKAPTAPPMPDMSEGPHKH